MALKNLAKRTFRNLPTGAQTKARRWRNRLTPLPKMSIGELSGSSPWQLGQASTGSTPAVTADDVTDASAAFVADPFGVCINDRWYLFFEIMNRRSGKGEIGYATREFQSDNEWHYGGLILRERFHLSYPAIYVVDSEIFMIPESFEAGQIRLYRAKAFPDTWELDSILVDDVSASDPTVYRGDDGWRMLACSASGNRNETLLEFAAPSIRGPWQETPRSPLIEHDSVAARPGGHCFTYNGIRYRLAQDCSTRYGERLNSYPVDSALGIDQRPVLQPTGSGWMGRGAHHADIHKLSDDLYLAFTDGEAW